MLSGFVVCMLVAMVGAKAVVPWALFSTVHNFHQKNLGVRQEDQPRPCCSPSYFTFDEISSKTHADSGELVVEMLDAEGAYDAIGERTSVKFIIDFLNGTVDYYRVIMDYKAGVAYEITKTGEDVDCYVYEIKGAPFEEECVPDDATYIGAATIGDHVLNVDTWYSKGKSVDVLATVQRENCIPISLVIRQLDPETGKEVSLSESRLFNFNLGICDPDKYFKIPDICGEGRALAKPTPKMLKMRRRGLFY